MRTNKEYQRTPTFRTCFGRVSALKRSATVLMPSSVSIEVKEDLHAYYHFSEDNNSYVTMTFQHNTDPYYNPKDGILSKMNLPWRMQEDTGVSFVFARHIRNMTHMMIPSGVSDFKHQHSMNVFNLIRKVPHSYIVDFRTPLLALYPQSDKPLHVESYYDIYKFNELQEKTAIKSWFTGSGLKLNKLSIDNG
jgi:hypothetical protein